MFSLYPRSVYRYHEDKKAIDDPEIDRLAKEIYAACKGFGTDEKRINDILGSSSPDMRFQIMQHYNHLYKTSLKKRMKQETSGDYGRLLQMISVPLPEFEASLLRKATKGMGTDEKAIYRVVMGRSPEDLQVLKQSYFKKMDKDLGVVLNSETSGDFKKILLAFIQASQQRFDPETHTPALAEQDAEDLYAAGEGRFGTDEKKFIDIVINRPVEHVRRVNDIYVSKHDHNIVKACKKEFSGDAEKALVFHANMIIRPLETLAELFESTMKGLGTDETGLSTCLVRYQQLLPQIKEAYEKKYGKSLHKRIHGETSGDYRDLLLKILESPVDSTGV